MADDITAKRQQIELTRARIDDHLDELTGHVPAKDDLKAVAAKYGAAVGGAVAAVGVLVVVTKSKLAKRRDAKTGAAYAKALMAAFPDIADAYRTKVAEDLVVEAAVDPQVLAEAVTDEPSSPRGGVPTALLTGLGVVAGVAISKAVNDG